MEETDLVVLWGSNARDAHPIFFHHVLKGIHNGAKLYAVDPRKSSSAQWAVPGSGHLQLHVGTDIPLANAVAREILAAGLENRSFIEHATSGFAELRRQRRAVDAGARRGRHRRAGGADPRAGPCLRPRRPRRDLLDARHHRAPQRGGQRPRADQPQPAHRPRRALRLRRRSPARTEQCPGGRRHGRAARPAARLPARRERRAAGEVRARLGRAGARPGAAGTSPGCSRPWSAAS